MLHVPRTVRAGALLAVAATALTACGTATGAKTTAETGKPVSGGTLVYLEDRQESCIDPQIGGDIPQAMIGQQYTDDIVYEGKGGKIEPWLAKSWTISPNGLTYTFTLRDDVKFTDGTPLNAAAVQANFTRVVNPKTGSSTDGGYIAPFYKSSKVLSPYVLQVTLKTPDSSFLDVLAQGYFGIESPEGIRARDLEELPSSGRLRPVRGAEGRPESGSDPGQEPELQLACTRLGPHRSGLFEGNHLEDCAG